MKDTLVPKQTCRIPALHLDRKMAISMDNSTELSMMTQYEEVQMAEMDLTTLNRDKMESSSVDSRTMVASCEVPL